MQVSLRLRDEIRARQSSVSLHRLHGIEPDLSILPEHRVAKEQKPCKHDGCIIPPKALEAVNPRVDASEQGDKGNG